MPEFELDPTADFQDPRLTPHFQLSHYPLSSGQPAPDPGTGDRHDHRSSEFLAAYYAINVAQADLLSAADPTTAQRATLLDAHAFLEALEDRYAPIGFFGEPTMDGVFYTDIHFARPELPRIYQPASLLSSHIAVPGLEDIPASELIGPMITTRWIHGKAHL